MKNLVPGILAILIVLCSCSTKKSFLHQRYTHYKHHSPTLTKEHKACPDKNPEVVNPSAPEVVAVNPVSETATLAGPVKTTEPKLKYTRAVLNDVAKRLALKDKQAAPGLLASTSKAPETQVNKVKPIKAELTKQKRGLLWGVIDALLAIILIVVIVLLVTWLVIVLTGPAY